MKKYLITFIALAIAAVAYGKSRSGADLTDAGAVTSLPNGISLGNETLSNYDEGTFTPALIGATAGSVDGIGSYIRIGKLVQAFVDFTGKNTTGFTGTIRVTGLPFTSANNGQIIYAAMWNFNVDTNFAIEFQNNLIAALVPNTSQLIFGAQGTTSSASWSGPGGSGRYLRVSLSYITDDP